MIRILLALTLSLAGAKSWFDKSHGFLLPAAVSRPLAATAQFPLFWWNFIVLAPNTPEPWSELDAFCRDLRASAGPLLNKSACGQDPEAFRDLLGDWAADLSLRHDPPADWRAGLKQAQARLSVADRFLLGLLRRDPLRAYEDLQARVESRNQLTFDKKFGYFQDPETKRIVIPVQFAFPPEQTARTREFEHKLREHLDGRPFALVGLFGPHASTEQNEGQIHRDVAIISTAGLVLLALQIALSLYFRRARLLWLAPPVLVSTGLSTLVTCFLFGSIHGLTLAFGPAIVALAMDHGLFSCFHPRWKGAWRANFYGLITTIGCLAVLMFSSIPFLRQLMVFSIVGLAFGFLGYWILHRRWPDRFDVKPFAYAPRPTPLKFALVLILLAGAVAGAAFLRPGFSLQQMNYQPPGQFELTKWMFSHLGAQAPLLQVYGRAGQAPWNEVAGQTSAATELGVPVENVGHFLPPPEEQAAHRAGWQTRVCGQLDALETKLFAPFLNDLACGRERVRTLREASEVPAYLKDFYSGGEWVSLWLAANEKDADRVRARFPEAKSLREIVETFPHIIERETKWMAPLSILVAVLFLLNYYRSLYAVSLVLLPFFTGFGLFSLLALALKFDITFITLIALVMIFGFSLDYGVFAANLFTGREGPDPHGVWSSVMLAAFVMLLGFVPLVFCKHPVLLQLGQALVWGTAGTIVGAAWGIPSVDRYLRRPRA